MTVLVVYPDAGTGGTTTDGVLRRTGGSSSFTVIRNGAGVSKDDTGSNAVISATGSSVTNEFAGLNRYIATYDTSSITIGSTVSNVIKSVYPSLSVKGNAIGDIDLHVAASSPALDGTLAISDYSQVQRVSFGSIAYADYTGGAYQDVTLNASGISNINLGGISRFSIQTSWDINDSFTGSWVAFTSSELYFAMADAAGTTQDPKLTITYTSPGPPDMDTAAASSITDVTATLNGEITSTNGANSTVRGFYLLQASSGDPTSSDVIISESGDFGATSYNLSAGVLLPDSDYRVAAFSTNPYGTTTGPTVGFTTLTTPPTIETDAATGITNVVATLNGDITDAGSLNSTVRGFYLLQASSGDPTAGDTVISESGSFGAGVYSLSSGVFVADTDYRIAAFATNPGGTVIGATVGITTHDVPTVTTEAASVMTTSSFTANGTITDVKLSNATERGFYWKQASSGDPTAGDNTASTLGDFAAGAFTESITGLTDATDYRVAAFATNAYGTTIGTTVGVTTPNFKEVVAGTTGEFSAIITSLTPDTTYYVRSYATNTNGTAYGTESSFKTQKDFIPLILTGN